MKPAEIPEMTPKHYEITTKGGKRNEMTWLKNTEKDESIKMKTGPQEKKGNHKREGCCPTRSE